LRTISSFVTDQQLFKGCASDHCPVEQESALIISDLMVGFNNGPMYDMDEIVRFDDAIATANAINVRPDFWLFPFLNVYGIISVAKTSTATLWCALNMVSRAAGSNLPVGCNIDSAFRQSISFLTLLILLNCLSLSVKQIKASIISSLRDFR
jgi:hypothetical protein